MTRETRRFPRFATGLIAAVAAGTLTAAPAMADEVRPAVGGAFTFVGHGFGHGIGMSQWGAQSRAAAGQNYRSILDFYYPGTSVASRENRTLRVGLTGFSTANLTVMSPTNNSVSISGSGQKVGPGQRLVITPAGGGLAASVAGGWSETWGASTTISGPDGVLLVKPDGTSIRYDGSIRVVTGTNLTVVNDVALETYLRGVVPAESPASWNAQALQAQAVAARSYALSVLRSGEQTDICDTTACQVYRGAESRATDGSVTWSQPASTNAAIAATAGEVRAYGDDVAFTQFSSSNGGWTVAGSKPYLLAKEDPFSSPAGKAAGDTVASWTTTIPATTFNAGCAAGGVALGITVKSRDGRGDLGGRVTAATLTCTSGTVDVSGTKLRQLGGLRSDWFGIVSAVDLAYNALGGAGGPLGPATSPELSTPNGLGSYRHFTNSSIYASAATGAHDVRGEIRRHWAATGWESVLGFPTTGDTRTPNGSGYYTQFQGGAIYWSPSTGAQDVRGEIYARWAQLGWENGLGYPTTSDTRTPNGAGYYTHFQDGSIYYSPATGAREVRGAIRDRWAALGWENGIGFPTSGDRRTPNDKGFYAQFQGGSIYWSAGTGAHAVRGGLLATWGAQGWENGAMGFPTSEETWRGGVLVQTFQSGTLTYDPATGKVTRS
ncbi:MAG: SpoIID/LytB domain-containing protein [Janthinobacterium lividum]